MTKAERRAEALKAKKEADALALVVDNNTIVDDQQEEETIFDSLEGYEKGIGDVDEMQGVTEISTVAKYIEDDGYIAFDENNFRRHEKALMVHCFNVKRDKKITLFCSIALSADVRAGIKTDEDLLHLKFGEKTTKSGDKTLVLMVERGQLVTSKASAKTAVAKVKPKLSFDDLMKGL